MQEEQRLDDDESYVYAEVMREEGMSDEYIRNFHTQRKGQWLSSVPADINMRKPEPWVGAHGVEKPAKLKQPLIPARDYRHRSFTTGEDVRRVMRAGRTELETTKELPERQRQLAAYILGKMEDLGLNEVVVPLRVAARDLKIPVSSVQKAADALREAEEWVYRPKKLMRKTSRKVRRGTKYGNAPHVFRLSRAVESLAEEAYLEAF